MTGQPDGPAEHGVTSEFTPDRDGTIDCAYRLDGDPFSPTYAWQTVPLPEPVPVKAGVQYEMGIDEGGQPFVRQATAQDAG